jgi:hypothetical protein
VVSLDGLDRSKIDRCQDRRNMQPVGVVKRKKKKEKSERFAGGGESK